MKKLAVILLLCAPLATFSQVNFESSDLPIVILNTNVQGIQLEPEFNDENTFEWRYDVLPSGTDFYEILLNGQRESSGRIVVLR